MLHATWLYNVLGAKKKITLWIVNNSKSLKVILLKFTQYIAE